MSVDTLVFSYNNLLYTTGIFSTSDLNSLVEESLKMSNFNHPNVMKLIGVCIDREIPYIVMPYMTNGSLLSYLRNNREDLTTSDEDEDDVVRPSYIFVIVFCCEEVYMPYDGLNCIVIWHLDRFLSGCV